MEHITVNADMEQMYPVTGFVEDYFTAQGVSMGTVMKMNIAVDEIFSNIVNYSGASYAKISCEVTDDMAVLIFEDDGTPYNPLERDDTDTTLTATERGIGGLGILIVKKSMDEMGYENVNGKNILRIGKKK